MSSQTTNILQSYLRRLTNLSGNNRSLLVLRLSADQMLDAHSLGYLNGDTSFALVQALMARRSKKICPVLDSRMEAANEVSKKLKKLQRTDQFLYEERGSYDLHVGWPFVRGKFADGTWVRCPLLFFPVSLAQQGAHWVLEPREDAGITLNKSFLLAYSYYNQVKIDEALADTAFDDFDTDSTGFRTELYNLLKDKLEINFNPDNFQDALVPFQEFRREAFDAAHRNGEIKLYPEAVLGIFPQAGSQLVPDYLYMMERDSVDSLEDFFAARSAQVPAGKVYEEKMFTPFVLDAHQEAAIKAVKNGRSIVVQGPPGTGKSQLICNLLADAMASGKKALLVCQKRAALDVVYDRLKELDLGDFLGLVHDFRNDRKEIFGKIARQISNIDTFKAVNRGIDVIQTERRFIQLSRRIDQVVEELEEFKAALFDTAECGVAVKELYLTSDPLAPAINLKQHYAHFTSERMLTFMRKLELFAEYAAVFEKDDYPWRERKSFAAFTRADQQEIEETIAGVNLFQRKLAENIFRIIGVSLSLEDAESFAFREDDVLGMISVLKKDDTYRYFQAMSAEADDETSLLWLANTERVTLNCFTDEEPERTVPSEQLGKIQEALQMCMDARKNFLRRMRWEFFNQSKFYLQRVLVANGLAYNKTGLSILERRLDSRLNLEHHLTALKNKPWLIDMPHDYQRPALKAWFEKQKLAVRAKLIFNSIREVKDAIHVQKFNRVEFAMLFQELLRTVDHVPARKAEWLRYLTPYQYRQLISDPLAEPLYIKTLRRDFDNLSAYDQLRESLAEPEQEVIAKLHDRTQSWDAAALVSLADNSVRLAWIDHIETKYPILRTVSSLTMDAWLSEFRQHIAEKQQLVRQILLVRARQSVYEGIEYNRLNNRVTYRELLHQVTKKKKVWPVRKVIAEFKDELFQLVPCWLASPESVSAIFPMEPCFDIVIFDEASQCFAERSLPSMFRGKQLVIAGDDKQLRPNELYQVRWDDEVDTPDLEVDSALELAGRYLATVHLQGHYRSKSLELIEFSNRHFYENRLRLLPDRHTLNRGEAAIAYRHVNGIWEDQTNPVEAGAVVETVKALLAEQPQKEIGVVTFNAPQQMLILDLLETEFMREGKSLPASLFVKNIENVQGDEKDVIIFSVGYAPDKNGKMTMQFGSLNAVGGENRLNVAVTRAREKIVVVCSITPEQLKTDEAKNDGPRLLKQYLAFARDVARNGYMPSHRPAETERDEWYLKKRLQRWGNARLREFSFETNMLPFSDVNVRKENHHIGIVLTDDARYFNSLSAKDAYGYTPALLASKQWGYKTIFSRNFWRDKEKTETDLMVFIGSQGG